MLRVFELTWRWMKTVSVPILLSVIDEVVDRERKVAAAAAHGLADVPKVSIKCT